ncbi:hypothetical protein CGMCC3_g6533 [Colletotrichum fructicola]|nr:uncharacterized protein CGMCC3_g6533 [Colletotrichum fructicola]KAE9577295.1 hypothetical protein CGMCC3_g6533 [Colletotrichum fructicola]
MRQGSDIDGDFGFSMLLTTASSAEFNSFHASYPFLLQEQEIYVALPCGCTKCRRSLLQNNRLKTGFVIELDGSSTCDPSTPSHISRRFSPSLALNWFIVNFFLLLHPRSWQLLPSICRPSAASPAPRLREMRHLH